MPRRSSRPSFHSYPEHRLKHPRLQDMTLTWINMYFKLDVVTPRDLTARISGLVRNGEVPYSMPKN